MERLGRHLARPTAAGDVRDHASQQYTLANYERFHLMFSQMADRTIDCTARGIEEVATEVKALLESLSLEEPGGFKR
jgi:hypothetical protein